MDDSWSAVPEWIQKAEADWEVVQTLGGKGTKTLHDAIVFHAQQCTEKLLKARLIQLGQAIRKTHDLAALSQLLQQADADWSWDEDELEELSDGGVLSRYPGFDTSSEEMQKLTAIASRLRQALLGRLGTANLTSGQ